MEKGRIDISSESGLRKYFAQDDVNNYNRKSVDLLEDDTMSPEDKENMLRTTFSISDVDMRNQDINIFIRMFARQDTDILPVLESTPIDVSTVRGVREYFAQDDVNNYDMNSIGLMGSKSIPIETKETMMKEIFLYPTASYKDISRRQNKINDFIQTLDIENVVHLGGKRNGKSIKGKKKSKKGGSKRIKRTRRNKITKRNKSGKYKKRY